MPLNRDQLIKLLNLTRSEYDAEALNAIRRANALLRKHRATWEDLLALPQESAKARQPEPTQARQQRHRGALTRSRPSMDTGRPTQPRKCSSAVSDGYRRA